MSRPAKPRPGDCGQLDHDGFCWLWATCGQFCFFQRFDCRKVTLIAYRFFNAKPIQSDLAILPHLAVIWLSDRFFDKGENLLYSYFGGFIMNQKTKNALKELARSVLACVVSFITVIIAGGN